jgi:hypothetical protein
MYCIHVIPFVLSETLVSQCVKRLHPLSFGKLTKSEFPKFYHGIRAYWLKPSLQFLVFPSLLAAQLLWAYSPHGQCLVKALKELFILQAAL